MKSRVALAIPRRAVPWLLASQSYVLLQLVGHIPYWIYALLILALSWRSLTHAGRISYPNRLTKSLVVLAASAAIILTSRFDLESATAFLVAAGVLKLLEMRHLKDAYIVIFLSLFIQGIVFLFDQSILFFLLAVTGVWLLLSTLVLLHYARNPQRQRHKQAIKLSAQLMLLSLPMMLALYILFPRFGPLWGLTLQSNQALTGLSDQMNPADIAELSQSAELAFRVTFDNNQLPQRQDLYWRALVLEHYNGRQWRAQQVHQLDFTAASAQQLANSQLSYEIIQEATGQNWLFSLAPAASVEPDVGITDQGLLRVRRPIFQRKRYHVHQLAEQAIMPLSALEKRIYLQLPKNTNPRAQALAARLQQQASSEAELVDTFMRYFSQQNFSYTLKPQTLGQEEIDDFLFNSQAGFCAHYAGALTFLARSAGIPARVVAGYQGGEWNAADQYLTLRQYDAHAWVEIWQQDKGWVRYDPTAMIAADRIEYGLEQALAHEDSFLQGQLFSMQKYKNIAWLNRLRITADTINYHWQRWVLSYDNERQQGFLQKILGFKNWQQGLYVIATSFVLFFLAASLWLWWRLKTPKLSPFMQAWQNLQRKTEGLGVEAVMGETVGQYCARLARRFPQHQALITQTAERLDAYLYQPSRPPETQSMNALEESAINHLNWLVKRLNKERANTP